MKSIPIVAGRNIAERYGYDQVFIFARKVGEDGGEHMTTYGRDKTHCAIAARIGDFLKFQIMGWPHERSPQDFAIEFGEYLAKAAENYVEATTMFRSDDDMHRDRLRALSSAIYEFRKRAARASD